MSYDTTTTTVLTCDARACRASITVEGDEEVAWQAATAKGWGWDEGDTRDFCPWHTDVERRIQEPDPEPQPGETP